MHIELDPERSDQPVAQPGGPVSIPIPGIGLPIGLGDAAKRLTAAFGIKPCGGCRKRAETLNARVQFIPWDS
jgi:hypothetical protein